MEIKQGTPRGPSAALGRAGPGPWEGEPPWETDSQITGWWFQTCFFSISYMGCHPKPIDELIFSQMFFNHQADGDKMV